MLGSYETFKTEYLKLSNIDLSFYKESQMKRRIDNFVKKYKAQSYEEFLALLKKDPKAYESFVTYLTINVSEFFRNPLQWKTLEEKILPMLLEQRRGPLKVWSAACSTVKGYSDSGYGFRSGSFGKSSCRHLCRAKY